jgi:hypothetical protein
MQRWTDISLGICNPGNVVASAASIVLDEIGAPLRIAVEIVGPGGLALAASAKCDGQQWKDQQKDDWFWEYTAHRLLRSP